MSISHYIKEIGRGKKGEAVADPRRMPQMDGFVAGAGPDCRSGGTHLASGLPDLKPSRRAP